MKTLFRWLFRLFLLLVVIAMLLGIAVLLLKDSFAKSLAERNLRDGTGMDAKIAKFEVGLMTPTVHLEGLKIYNRPEFGGGAFLDMPELRIEYVPAEMRDRRLRFRTVRLNIAEVNIVRGKDGKTNIEAIERKPRDKSGGGGRKRSDTPGVEFGGVDTLYLTLGRIRITDLANPGNNHTINVGLKDEVGRNLKSEADVQAWLLGVVMKLYLQEAMRNPRDKSLPNLFKGIVPQDRKR